MSTSNQSQVVEKKRFRPAKVKITKAQYDALRILHQHGPHDKGITALGEVLKQVEDFQTSPLKSESVGAEGMKYRDCLDILRGLGVADKIILPDHGKAGLSIGRFVQQLAVLGVTGEDIEKMSDQMLRWKQPMSMEKFTAILPSMVTEARALKTSKPVWRPPTWETVDGTGESDF